MLFFQMAFSLHAAAERYSMKHYDVKLLNFLLQDADEDYADEDYDCIVMRYGLRDKVFRLRMPRARATIAKLADYGTADLSGGGTSSGTANAPVTLAHFTTLENSPPEQLILGEHARQGHAHDNWALGLCMIHLFTGHAPYEEIMESVKCPNILKQKLAAVWEDESVDAFGVLRSIIFADVCDDEGEKDETLYDTLYRYLVLFGIPAECDRCCGGGAGGDSVWRAIDAGLGEVAGKRGGGARSSDFKVYSQDHAKFNFERGSNDIIRGARTRLMEMEGGIELLRALTTFNPASRATAFEVLYTSKFMEPLREKVESERLESGGRERNNASSASSSSSASSASSASGDDKVLSFLHFFTN